MIKLAKWPFKSAGNFFITSLGFIGVSFWGYSIYSETKFNQPIIGESVKLLGRHQQVKELVNFFISRSATPSPIASQSATDSSRKTKKHISHSKSTALKIPSTSKWLQDPPPLDSYTVRDPKLHKSSIKSNRVSKLWPNWIHREKNHRRFELKR